MIYVNLKYVNLFVEKRKDLGILNSLFFKELVLREVEERKRKVLIVIGVFKENCNEIK